ncbi:hypothetical protein QTP86_013664, partial [Hemibagrus guttatus]
KGRELADMMERRKVDILCVQETRWKGSKARSIGAGFKLFYYGVDSKRNGVGVVLKEEFVRNVLEVKRVSDRVMSLKLETEGVMLNVVSGYAPQVGCELEEKESFWSELDEVMESIPTGERVVIGADFNGHVGEGNTGDEEVMGKFGVKERNLEGQMVVDFAKRMDMGVVNTYFQKREEHRVTYKSGGRRTQVDYILCRRGNLKEISDCKVVVGESVARQHRMVVCRMTLMVCKTKRSKIEKKTKWWKLKKEECCEEFRQKLRQALGGQVVLPDDWETTAEVIRETGRKVLGVSSGRRKEDKETWWWNEEVQDSVQRKRLAKKKWDMDRTEENRQEYKEVQRRVKREVSKAKQKAYEELYTRLDTREGEKDLYRLTRQRDRDGKDVQQVRVIKDRDGRVLTSEQSVQRRWKEYFEELMNEENEREKRVEGVNSVEQKVDNIRKDEVRKALKRMKSGKAVGPDDIPVEVWKCLGEAAVEFLASLFNRVLESERMPEEWRRSVLVPIFKNKGDVQSCSNYRGIKLMSHTMKVWERVVEARLRKVVEICEQQGFMPRKSTTDAIFALRILMEKYRDGQRELHCVFVDLEKAYDRVPREELWYCMRKSGVAEKYVRVVQDMYERSRTVVRCAVGQTEEFNVEVGLHQGSALSPFLFAMVMDQLSEEVRQESPWTMMFADDIVICSESREQVEENLERWRFALERRGMKVSRSKTEYMCVNEREGSGTVRLQGEEVKKVQEFKYLGSTVQSNGECGKEVKKRVQAGWNGWRKVSGVLCDQKISARIKGKVYRTVVRPAMLYGLETVSLRKRQESELEVAELKMLRSSLLLLAPLLADTDSLVSRLPGSTEGLHTRFHWIADHVPAFRVPGGRIHVLHSPDEFYQAMKARIKTARSRVVIASLYLGTGPLEQDLVDCMEQALKRSQEDAAADLKVSVLLDYTRGSRGKNNSRTMLLPLLQRFPEQMRVSLYHTPDLRGLLRLLVPERFNETIGVQHIKVYLFDNSLIISGANLSESYFTNRQDRYVLLEDCQEVADFFAELVGAVGDVSLQLAPDDSIHMMEGMVHPYKGKQDILDEEVTQRLLMEADGDSTVYLTSGYFNLTQTYMRLVLGAAADYRILMASPEVNGFFGAKGVAGAIPEAYIHLAHQFYSKVCELGQQDRVHLHEYHRPDWTFHAKGLWYYLEGNNHPCLTLIGSPNFGYRSVHRDIEAQIAIVTENAELQTQLQQEQDMLYRRSTEVSGSTFKQPNRYVKLWVKLVTPLIKNFF